MTDLKLAGPEAIILHLSGHTKMAVIDELLKLAERSGKLRDIGAARKAVLDREKLMSTGMQFGLAIPHGKLDEVDEVLAFMGISDEGIDFDSFDGEPARIIVLTLSPAGQTGPHLRFLADISLLLRDDAVRAAILAARTPEEVFSILSSPR